MLKTIAITLALAVATAAPLSAQNLAPKSEKIPPGQEPPPGMCRIWLNGVPPGQQPAPTDCATAVRNRPANGRVIFGDDYVDGRKRPKSDDERRRTAPREERDDRGADRASAGRDDGDADRRAKREDDADAKRRAGNRRARQSDSTRGSGKP
jgi:hypothetical protein